MTLFPELAEPSGDGGVYVTYTFGSQALEIAGDEFWPTTATGVLLLKIEGNGSIGYYATIGSYNTDSILSMSLNKEEGNNSVMLLFERGTGCGTYLYIDGSGMEQEETIYTCGHHNSQSYAKRYLISFGPDGGLEDRFIVTASNGGNDSYWDYGLNFEQVLFVGDSAYILAYQPYSYCQTSSGTTSAIQIRVKPVLENFYSGADVNTRISDNRTAVCTFVRLCLDDYRLVHFEGSVYLWPPWPPKNGVTVYSD